MCGIAGFWSPRSGLTQERALADVRKMADALALRGPDAEGFWIDEQAGVALGHRRLSIIDLSAAGAQPMLSASGRYVIIYNGEIFNSPDVRRDLTAAQAAPAWRGHSDTETLLAAIEHHGVEKALQRCFGQFAFALWDRKERALWLARDRLGEKPLYYGTAGGALVFGSELKALRAFAGFDATLNPQAVRAFLEVGYVPAPLSIYASVKKLPAGCYLRLSAPSDDAIPQAYWSLEAVITAGAAGRAGPPPDIDETERLLGDVVASQMASDVPLGAFLSGGIDSSLITALMQQRSSQSVRTFSIGFQDQHFDEAPFARAVAAHLRTDHTELKVTERDALDMVPQLPSIYDEPFADSSQIPTALLARLTRRHVTVALSGDGGDEVFGGYNRYIFAPMVWSATSKLPGPARRAVGSLLSALGSTRSLASSQRIRDGLTRLGLPRTTLNRLSHLGHVIHASSSLDNTYRSVTSLWADSAALMKSACEGRALPDLEIANLSAAERMMALDALTYLPDDIMVKVDRATMAASLEGRAPFLDPRVVEHAWSLPLSAKIEKRKGKQILRHILARHVPMEMFERPKQGFSIPLDAWLRGGLRDWAQTLLSPQALASSGLLHDEPIVAAWEAHSAGRSNAGPQLWSVLMLQSWLKAQAAP